MKLSLLFAVPALLASAELSGVRNVYILPMGRGLDQYLANRLTGDRVFQVVTDPKLADAIFTDRIGEPFQAQLEILIPPPPEPAKAKEPLKESATSKKKESDEPHTPLSFTETANHLDNPSMNSSFSRGKGTIFLVDIKSRSVLWSVFEPARGTGNKDLDRTASDIVSRLMKDLGLKK